MPDAALTRAGSAAARRPSFTEMTFLQREALLTMRRAHAGECVTTFAAFAGLSTYTSAAAPPRSQIRRFYSGRAGGRARRSRKLVSCKRGLGRARRGQLPHWPPRDYLQCDSLTPGRRLSSRHWWIYMPIPRDPKASPASRSLNDRVQEQIDAATSKLSPNKRPRRHAERPALLGGNGPQELRALQRVFREMGRSQRAARRQAGLAPSSVVREAAQAFRRAPSFTTLVGVAASLDEVGLLSW